MKNKRGPPYVYKTDKEYELLERDYEIAVLREALSATRIQMHEYHQTALRAMIVAVKFRDLFDGLFERLNPKIEAMLEPPKPAPKKRKRR